MPNEEYLKRQQRKRYVAIGSTIVSVLIIVGWITFYQVPESNTDAPSLSEQIQGTWNETREEYDPVIVEDSFNEAIEAFNTAIEIDNNFAEAWYQIGLVYGSTYKYEEAINALNTASMLDPNFSKALKILGLTCESLKKYKEAEYQDIRL